jgi:carbon monoxide dehydrogenase subunit G
VLLQIDKSVSLHKSAEAVWDVVRDPVKVAACIPNVRDFKSREGGHMYSARIEDKLGPFRVEVPVSIDVGDDATARRMTAVIVGNDKFGQARVRGEVAALVLPETDGARLELTSRIEVLGRLAALGAVPMRRRADQIFDVFVGNLTSLVTDSKARERVEDGG